MSRVFLLCLVVACLLPADSISVARRDCTNDLSDETVFMQQRLEVHSVDQKFTAQREVNLQDPTADTNADDSGAATVLTTTAPDVTAEPGTTTGSSSGDATAATGNATATAAPPSQSATATKHHHVHHESDDHAKKKVEAHVAGHVAAAKGNEHKQTSTALPGQEPEQDNEHKDWHQAKHHDDIANTYDWYIIASLIHWMIWLVLCILVWQCRLFPVFNNDQEHYVFQEKLLAVGSPEDAQTGSGRRPFRGESYVGGHAEHILKTGHFHCGKEPFLCLCACCCPALLWAHTLWVAKFIPKMWFALLAFWACALCNCAIGGSFFMITGIFTALLLLYYRRRLRDNLPLSEPRDDEATLFKVCCGFCLIDFFYVCCCPWCAIAQEARVVRWKWRATSMAQQGKFEHHFDNDKTPEELLPDGTFRADLNPDGTSKAWLRTGNEAKYHQSIFCADEDRKYIVDTTKKQKGAPSPQMVQTGGAPSFTAQYSPAAPTSQYTTGAARGSTDSGGRAVSRGPQGPAPSHGGALRETTRDGGLPDAGAMRDVRRSDRDPAATQQLYGSSYARSVIPERNARSGMSGDPAH